MYPQAFEELISAFQKLPGVGRKTAERYAFEFLKWDKEKSSDFVEAIENRFRIKRCSICGNLSDGDICFICQDDHRDHETICVVENPKDVNALEKMDEFHGVYHVLNGDIDVKKGILPEDLNIPSLEKRVKEGKIKEVILALNPSMEGETTALYLSRLLKNDTKVSRLAYGIPMGGSLDYVDAFTLKRAFAGRTEAED